MASNTSTICLRALRKHSCVLSQKVSLMQRLQTARALHTTSPLFAELPEANQPFASSVPPVTPMRAEGKNRGSLPPHLETAAEFRHMAGRSRTETYTAYGVTENLIRECSKQADYTIPQAQTDEEMPKTADGEDLGVGQGWWHNEVGLKPTFSTWSQVTMLHMYLLSARFRCFPADYSQVWQQHLLDHFFYEAENKMTINHNMHARGTRNKYLKDLFIQWRGLLAAYDEGITKGDAVLASAIWRNVFKAGEDVDIKHLAGIVSYMRRALRGLDALPDESVTRGDLVFGNPAEELKNVAEKSRMLDLPFKDGSVVNEPVAPMA